MDYAGMDAVAIIEKHHLRICPVLNRRGELQWWLAGRTTVVPSTGHNIVNDQAWGHTLAEAASKFEAGQLYIRDGLLIGKVGE